MRTELTFPAKISKRTNSSSCIPILKSYMDMLGVRDGDEVDVTIKVICRENPSE